MSTAVARLIDLITKKGYPITTAANLAALNEGTEILAN